MIHDFLSYLQHTKGYSNNTIKSYGHYLFDLSLYLREVGKVETAATLNDIQIYLDALRLSPSTKKLMASAYRSYYRWLRHKGFDTDKNIRYLETPKLAKRIPHTINVEEIAATLNDKSINGEVRAMIALIRYTGLRISEVLNLRLSDINKEMMSIIVTGKGAKERVVYYNETLRNYLNANVRPTEGKLFRFSDREARYLIHAALIKHSSATYNSPHILRHTFASDLLGNGCPLMTIKELLGHESVKTTEGYLRVNNNNVKSDYLQYCG